MFDLSPMVIFLSFSFGLVGAGYFTYGKKHNLYFMLAGSALMLYPFFISTPWPLFLWGLGLAILPFILNRII